MIAYVMVTTKTLYVLYGSTHKDDKHMQSHSGHITQYQTIYTWLLFRYSEISYLGYTANRKYSQNRHS